MNDGQSSLDRAQSTRSLGKRRDEEETLEDPAADRSEIADAKGPEDKLARMLESSSPGDFSWNEASYSVKDVTSALGISRSTLLWYEKIGIVSPVHDPASGWREYSASDIFKLMGATTLKNSGVALSDLEGEFGELAFTPEKIDGYIDYSKQQEKYFHAQAECLQSIKEVIEHSGEMQVGTVDEFYFYPDSSEKGYHDYSSSEQLDLLVRKLPISALGAVCESDWGEPIKIRWGRTVPACYARLFDLSPCDYERFGGCLCLCYFYASKSLPVGAEEQAQGLKTMEDYLEPQGLVPSGRLFVPRVIPLGKGACSALCLPVKQEED